jgi:AcrR family transcriptional regulator
MKESTQKQEPGEKGEAGGEGPRRRGRPKGRTAQGEASREELYRIALRLIADRGFEAATLREIAQQAGVSPALLYKYFPSKRAVVLALYEELSVLFAGQAAGMPAGNWRSRFLFALKTSLHVLGPHRKIIGALIPVMLSDSGESIFAPETSQSRSRVQPAFQQAVYGASDAPKPADALALGRLLYIAQLGVLMFWLLDRSPRQKATSAFLDMLATALPLATLALKVGPVRSLMRTVDRLFQEALFGEGGDPLATTDVQG